jgi:CRP-like cAMP-binding protein
MSLEDNIFMKLGKIQKLKKDDYIFKQGEIDSNIYFITKGLIKAYYLTNDGKEFVKSFLDSGDLVGSLRSAYKDVPCYFSVVCLEDAEVLSVPFDQLLEHSKKDIKSSSQLIESLINLSMKKEKREYEFLCLSAQERYELFLEENSKIINRISLHDTAKFLGITPIALSRIRKRISE